MDTKSLILLILILVGVGFGFYFLHKNFKFPRSGMFSLVVGGVKSGKTTYAVSLALKTYKRVHRRWAIRRVFLKMLHKEPEEEPLLYSNIPLLPSYVKITEDLLLRKVRPRFGSVIFIDEASLVADSQLIKDCDINTALMLFVKLVGHELHGNGALIVNTQAVSDLHYNFRRCCDKRFYVEHTFKWLPFFLVQTIREERYSDDGSVINAYNEDLTESVRKVLVRKKVWKAFSSTAFSTFTDNKPVLEDVTYLDKYDSLKVQELVSFSDYSDFIGDVNNEKEDNK